MPLYEYQCDACGRRFERIQKFSDPPIDVCPHCGEGPVKKLLSSPAIQFKGSGWYITDYARKPAGGDAKSGDAKSGDAKSASTDASSTSASSRDSSSSTSKPAETAAKKD